MEKYTYFIKNIDCAHCASDVEKRISKINGLNNVNYNFASTRLTFETEQKPAEFESLITKAINSVEPDGTLVHMNAQANIPTPPSFKWDLIIFLVGAVLGIIAFVLEKTVEIDWLIITLYCISACVLISKTFIKAMQQLFLSKTIAESMLITIAVIGCFALAEYEEGLMVIGLYSIGKMLEARALFSSRKSIQGLMEIQPEYAILIDGRDEHRVAPADVKIGSIIIVRAGERVALDGTIISGGATINCAHLTGESLPSHVKKGDKITSGSVVTEGMIEIRTESEYKDSTVARIMGLIENATDKKSKTETFVAHFSKWYTITVMALAVLVTVICLACGVSTAESINKGLIFLVISCPCAFAISVPLAYFSAIGKASRRGILIKGSNYLDVATHIKRVVFDKTGTLTTGQFGVEHILVLDNHYTEQDILKLAAMGEQHSIHPIAKAIIHKAHGITLDNITDFREDAGTGVYYKYNGDDVFVGRDKDDKTENTTSIFVHINGKAVGEIFLADAIKAGSKPTCDYLKSQGIAVTMLSGDGAKITERVAGQLGINDYKHSMLPEQKYEWLENEIKKDAGYISFVGDGINDAPSLRRADLGVSMGMAGSPVTVEASDIVLVDDEPTKLVDVIRLSKYTRSVVIQNIIFAIVTKIIILVLGSLGIAGLLAAVFADVGVTLIAILSSLRILKFNFDKYQKQYIIQDRQDMSQLSQ